jgi:Ni,Fe-hydrogenase III small subunit
MLRILNKIRNTGILTERPPHDSELETLGREVKRHIDRHFRGSLAIRQVDERFGVHFVASPRHADALLVTGPVSRHMETALRRSWRATPSPKFVIASGDCACDGGEFGVSYASCGAVENVIPVDVKIPGCPPTPSDLLNGLLGAFHAATPGMSAEAHSQNGDVGSGTK